MRTSSLLFLATSLLFSVSCITSPPIAGDVDSFERNTGGNVSDLPDTGEDAFVPAAERYSNPNSYRGPYGRYYGGQGYGYGYGYGAY